MPDSAKCPNPDCDAYPFYGLAPHRHVRIDLSDPKTFIGSTVLDSKETWPINFKEDAEAPGCGIYLCPSCLDAPGLNPMNEIKCQACENKPESEGCSTCGGYKVEGKADE